MLIVRSILAVLLIPGIVTVLIPYLLASDRIPVALAHPGPLQFFGVITIAAGAAIMGRTIWEFAVFGRGTLAPVDPPTRLVVQGLYRYVRNPMYVGAFVLMIGETLALQSTRILEWVAFWTIWVNAFVIFYEEPALKRRFGDSYNTYRQTVRRWIPGPAAEDTDNGPADSAS